MIWKPVIGWEDSYEVSDAGNVRALERRNTRSDGTVQTWSAGPMTPYPNYKGYLVVRLSRPGQRKMARVHRLVAEAHLPSGHTSETVNHKDGDKTNNRVTNLEWATIRENTLHSIASGLGTYAPPGSRKHAALSSLPPTPTDTGWRDIATAPRDGTMILVAYDDSAARTGRLEGPRERVYEAGWDEQQATFAARNGFLLHSAATHWMPLPPAPTDTGRE